MWPNQLHVLIFIYVEHFSVSWLYIIFFISYSLQSRSFPVSFSGNMLQNFQVIPKLISEVYKFHNYNKLSSKRRILLVFFLKFKSNLPVRRIFPCWMVFLQWQSCINFMYRSYIICYHGTQIFEIPHCPFVSDVP